MSTARDTYHHGDLRTALIDAALAMLEAGEPFSLRAVARRAEVSQTAPYRHFADREALESALAVRGFQDLRRELSPTGALPASEDELVEFAVAYVRFALRRPAVFRLMFGQECDDSNDARVIAAAELQSLVRDSVGAIYPDADSDVLPQAVWALAHGLAFLHLDGKFSATSDDEVAARVRAAFLGIRALGQAARV